MTEAEARWDHATAAGHGRSSLEIVQGGDSELPWLLALRAVKERGRLDPWDAHMFTRCVDLIENKLTNLMDLIIVMIHDFFLDFVQFFIELVNFVRQFCFLF